MAHSCIATKLKDATIDEIRQASVPPAPTKHPNFLIDRKIALYWWFKLRINGTHKLIKEFKKEYESYDFPDNSSLLIEKSTGATTSLICHALYDDSGQLTGQYTEKMGGNMPEFSLSQTIRLKGMRLKDGWRVFSKLSLPIRLAYAKAIMAEEVSSNALPCHRSDTLREIRSQYFAVKGYLRGLTTRHIPDRFIELWFSDTSVQSSENLQTDRSPPYLGN